MTESAIRRPQAALIRLASEAPVDEELGSRSSALLRDTPLRDSRAQTQAIINYLRLGFITYRLLRLTSPTLPRELPFFGDPVPRLHPFRASRTVQARRRLQADLNLMTSQSGEEFHMQSCQEIVQPPGSNNGPSLDPFQVPLGGNQEGTDICNATRREKIGEILGPIMNPGPGKGVVLLCWGPPNSCQILPIAVEEMSEGVELWDRLQKGWYQARGSWRKRMPYWQVKRVEKVKVSDKRCFRDSILTLTL